MVTEHYKQHGKTENRTVVGAVLLPPDGTVDKAVEVNQPLLKKSFFVCAEGPRLAFRLK